jgi:small subunit ribosomal protein S29e
VFTVVVLQYHVPVISLGLAISATLLETHEKGPVSLFHWKINFFCLISIDCFNSPHSFRVVSFEFFLSLFNQNCILSTLYYKLLLKMAESRKPNKLYATHPKGYGKGSRACRVTGREGGMGLIRKYGINMKRQVFRERAIDMGWNKYN